jgi:hypothetical protein
MIRGAGLVPCGDESDFFVRQVTDAVTHINLSNIGRLINERRESV